MTFIAADDENKEICPKCGSAAIEYAKELEFADDGAIQKITCLDCGATGTVDYELIGYSWKD